MAGVILDAELVVDQVRHPRTGPKRGFIAQLLWAFQQQFLQAFPIRLSQFRFSARTLGLLQRLPAAGSELLSPATHCLAAHRHAACHLGLVEGTLFP